MPGPSEQDLIDTIMGNDIVAPEAAELKNPVTDPAPTEPIPPTNNPDAPIAPVADPAPAPQTVPTTGNFDEELLKISGGTVKSKDEFVSLIERSKQATELETRLKAFEDENTSLKAQVNTEVFATPFLKGLNDLYKANANDSQIQAYTTLNKVNLEELQPLEVRMLALQSQNGLTPEEAKTHLEGKYKLDPNVYDEATVRSATIDLKIDAKSDLDFLRTQKAESAIPPIDKSQQELQQKTAAHVEKLQPIVQNVVNTLAFAGLSINGKTGEDALTADFSISEDSKKGLMSRMEGYIQQYGPDIPATPEGAAQIKEFAENVLVLQNWKNWLAHAASTREAQVRAEYVNPTSIDRGESNPDKGKTSKEELGEWLLANG